MSFNPKKDLYGIGMNVVFYEHGQREEHAKIGTITEFTSSTGSVTIALQDRFGGTINPQNAYKKGVKHVSDHMTAQERANFGTWDTPENHWKYVADLYADRIKANQARFKAEEERRKLKEKEDRAILEYKGGATVAQIAQIVGLKKADIEELLVRRKIVSMQETS